MKHTKLLTVLLAALLVLALTSPLAAQRVARILVAEDDADFVDFLDENGVWKNGLTLGVDFDEGDELARGDIDGDSFKETLVVEDNGDRVDVYKYHEEDEATTWDHHFQLSVDFDGGDAFTVGDIDGDGVKEILIVEDDEDFVDVLDEDGFWTSSERGFRLARTDFDEGDGFAVGDIDGDGNTEVLVVEDDGDRVDVLDVTGNRIRNFQLAVDFDGGDAFAVGDLNGDGKAEILVVEDDGDFVDVLDEDGFWTSSERGFQLSVDFDGGDAFAVSD